MVARFALGGDAHIAEVASNDGYLLRWFLERGLRETGIEPAANCAAAAETLGVRPRYCSLPPALRAGLPDDVTRQT
jgi:hypothetical protein